MHNIPTLPMALTIMMGPQILVAILLITRKDVFKSSLIYITSITLTTILITYFYYWLVGITHFHDIKVAEKPVYKYCIVALLILLIIKNIVNRNKLTNPPKWMAKITTASLSEIFLIGLLLILIMPGDIIATFTIGNILFESDKGFYHALPFFIAVFIIAATPLIIYLLMGKKGHVLLNKFNNWLNTHGYVINIMVNIIFIFMIL